MENIGDLARHKSQELKDRENTIRVVGADPMSKRGFTQVPNFILENDALSTGAKLTYAMMLRYAWGDGSCYPGQKKLAADAGMGVRSVVRHIKELETVGFIKINRRGLGKVNVYDLHMRIKKQK
jgi:hypothetical protein